MEGCGNDYVYINCLEEQIDMERVQELAVAVSERHFGVGSDGLVLILPSETADFRMRMFNNDGSESEMCGNATRCIGKYVYDRGLTDKTQVSLETLGGIKYLDLHLKDGVVDTVTVDMGAPILDAADIPVLSAKHPVVGETVTVLDRTFAFTCVSMGNPHAVTFLQEPVWAFDIGTYGAKVEVLSLFPKKTNVEFVNVISREELHMRVWERGSGETLACGTGACATAVAAVLNGLCDRRVNLKLLGGELSIEWRESDNHVYMTGPARFSFDGVWLR